MGCPFSQGIGLRPQPWARVSRPVGPERSIDKNRSMSSSPRPCGAGLQTPPSRPGVETGTNLRDVVLGFGRLLYRVAEVYAISSAASPTPPSFQITGYSTATSSPCPAPHERAILHVERR